MKKFLSLLLCMALAAALCIPMYAAADSGVPAEDEPTVSEPAVSASTASEPDVNVPAASESAAGEPAASESTSAPPLAKMPLPSVPEPAPAAASITLALESDAFKQAVPDENFRIVIWNAIEGEIDLTGPDAATILARYTGEINAKNKGIQDVHGLELLTHAELVDLTGNPVSANNGDWSWLERKDEAGKIYYGSPASSSGEASNVTWKLNKIPFVKLPSTFGGRLVIAQPGTTSSTYPGDEKAADKRYEFVRREKSEKFPIELNVGRCTILGSSDDNSNVQDGFVKLVTLNLIKETTDPDPDVDGGKKPLTLPMHVMAAGEGSASVPNECVKIENILLNEKLMLGVGTEEVLHYETTDEYGTITSGSQSFKYYINFESRIYDKVSLKHGNLGSASVTKLDAVTGKPLMGAEYALYQGETLVQDGLETDEDGLVVVRGLQEGDYTFVETKAPEGYQLDATPLPVFVGDGENVQHGTLGGGAGTSVTAIDVNGASVTEAAGTDEIFIAGKYDDSITGASNPTEDLTLTVTGGPTSVIVSYSAVARSDGERGPNGEVDERPMTHMFATAEEALADVNFYKNQNRIAGPVEIYVQYAPMVSVTHKNQPIPPPPVEETPPTPPTPQTPPTTGNTEPPEGTPPLPVTKVPKTGAPAAQEAIVLLGASALGLLALTAYRKKRDCGESVI